MQKVERDLRARFCFPSSGATAPSPWCNHRDQSGLDVSSLREQRDSEPCAPTQGYKDQPTIPTVRSTEMQELYYPNDRLWAWASRPGERTPKNRSWTQSTLRSAQSAQRNATENYPDTLSSGG